MARIRPPEICFLTGLPGCGKSTMANQLEQYFRWSHFDVDHYLNHLPTDLSELVRLIAPHLSEVQRRYVESLDVIADFRTLKKLLFSPLVQEIKYDLMYRKAMKEALGQVKKIKGPKRNEQGVVMSCFLQNKSSRNEVISVCARKRIRPVLVQIRANVEDLVTVAKTRSQQLYVEQTYVPATPEQVRDLAQLPELEPGADEKWERVVSFAREELRELKMTVVRNRILGLK